MVPDERVGKPALDEWQGAVGETTLTQIGAARRHSVSPTPVRAASSSADAVPTVSAAMVQLEHPVLLCEDSYNLLRMMLFASQHPALMTDCYHYVVGDHVLKQLTALMSGFSKQKPLQYE